MEQLTFENIVECLEIALKSEYNGKAIVITNVDQLNEELKRVRNAKM